MTEYAVTTMHSVTNQYDSGDDSCLIKDDVIEVICTYTPTY